MKNKAEIMKTASTVLYLVSVVFFVLSIVGMISDSGIVQPMYLLYGAVALGLANLLKNAANRKK